MGKIDLTKLSDYYALAVESFYNQKTERNLQLCISNSDEALALETLLKSEDDLSDTERLITEEKLKAAKTAQLSDWNIDNTEMKVKFVRYITLANHNPFWLLYYEITCYDLLSYFQISVDDTGVFNYQLSIQQESF